MTVSNHIATVVTVAVGAYEAHLWWADIGNSLCLLVPSALFDTVCVWNLPK